MIIIMMFLSLCVNGFGDLYGRSAFYGRSRMRAAFFLLFFKRLENRWKAYRVVL